MTRSVRNRLIAIGIALFLLVVVIPAGADVTRIDPNDPPDVTLSPEDAEKLRNLQSAEFSSLLSPLSPNGRHIFTNLPDAGPAFLNVRTGKKVVVDPAVIDLNPLTEFRWRGNHTMASIGADPDGKFYRVRLKRRTGQMISTPIELPGWPLSLSNAADKVLCVRRPQGAPSVAEKSRISEKSAHPVRKVALPQGYLPPGPAKFAYEDRLEVQVTTEKAEYIIFDLNTKEVTSLMEVPVNVAVLGGSWSPDDERLAIARWQVPRGGRGGMVPLDSPEVKDALGQLPPEENPFFTSSAVDLFVFAPDEVEHLEIRPEVEDGAFFSDCEWDPFGMFFVARMWTASSPSGRTYPSYTQYDGSKYRFYGYDGEFFSELDHPDVEARFGLVRMISPWEVLIHAPSRTDYTVFHYDLFDEKLKRLATPEGSVYQFSYSACRNEMVYSFSSYQQPYEIFRQKLSWDEPRQVTHYNDHLRHLNQVRADMMEFPLSNGDERVGYLIQPADAAFPPVNVPIVVWQQGGPSVPMTQEWGGYVEMPFNLLPNFGFAVLMVPLPGRDGFGREFSTALADGNNFGQVDIDEQVEIIDQLADGGITSWDRTGVTGCSYGGYFAAQSATRHNGLYAAANPQCSLLDLTHEFETGYTAFMAYLMGSTPENESEYHQDTPLARAGMVETPTLIFSGSDDFLPAYLSREFHDKINVAGTKADFYEFIGEEHGLREKTSQFAAGQAQLEWFRTYLMNDEK